MNKNILTIALIFIMLFMISCSAENYDIEDDTHTNTISHVNTAANITQASDYILPKEPEAKEDTAQTPPPINPVTESVPQANNTDNKSGLTNNTPAQTESEIYEGLYTIIYDKIPPLETKIFNKEKEEAKEAKKEKEKEKAKKPAQKKAGQIVSSFKTFFNAANKPRVTNIKKAANLLNGAVIKPGRVFSFNKYIGPTNESNGYKPATVIVQGKETKGFGGGVCQVSTTLFNACEEAGMEILERHSHSKKVPYVPEGKDAAVSYGGVDFKFKNAKDYSVRLKANVSKGAIVVSLEKI